MIGIVIALKSEASSLLSQIEDLKQIKLLDKTAYTGKINGREVVIAISGIGKVSAAITTQAIIDKFSPDFILNAGTCGGSDQSVKVKNFYAIEKCFQFDFDVTAIDNVEVGYIQEYDRVFFPTHLDGLDFLPKTSLATADRFSNAEKDLTLIAKNRCAVRDMEGAAIAQTCLSNGVKFLCIKGVTDVYGSGNDGEQFLQNLRTVCDELPQIIIKAIAQI